MTAGGDMTVGVIRRQAVSLIGMLRGGYGSDSDVVTQNKRNYGLVEMFPALFTKPVDIPGRNSTRSLVPGTNVHLTVSLGANWYTNNWIHCHNLLA